MTPNTLVSNSARTSSRDAVAGARHLPSGSADTRAIATKRGLAAALHSGDPAFGALPAYFRQHLEPGLQLLLDAAVAAGQIRDNIEPYELLRAVANLSISTGEDGPRHGRRMVDLLIDGLRYRSREADLPRNGRRPTR